MKIRYSVRSSFLLPCKGAIRNGGQRLQNGGSVSVNLPSGGYDGHVYVNIRPRDPATFETNWANSDPTRFPARIKAAATALKDSGYIGRFEITHTDGILGIRQA